MKYDLVFEGGGAKGMVFVGALQEFEAWGHQPNRLLGTSAGAITAAFLAAGYDSREMLAALSERQDGRHVFADFLGAPGSFEPDEIEASALATWLRAIDFPVLPNVVEERLDNWLLRTLLQQPSYRALFSFVERGGWYAADHFLAWLKRKLDEGTFRGQPRRFSPMTLAEFYEATETDLSLIAADTTANQLLVLNHYTAPSCPVVWAVRMSMSLPLVWQEVEWQPDWGLYRGTELAGHAVVDGGMLSNFPIELFLSNQPFATALMGPKTGADVLGFLIDESLPVEGISAGEAAGSGFSLGSLRTVQRIQRLINTMTQAHDKKVLEQAEELVVRLPARGYGTTEFDMSDERRAALIRAGQLTMRQFFQAREEADSRGSLSSGAPDGPPVEEMSQVDRTALRVLQP